MQKLVQEYKLLQFSNQRVAKVQWFHPKGFSLAGSKKCLSTKNLGEQLLLTAGVGL